MIARLAPGLLVLIVALAGSSRAAEPEPEPPDTPFRQLQGKWSVRVVLVQGKERAMTGTYTFTKDKVTISPIDGGKGGPREMVLTPDKTRKDLFEMKYDRRPAVRYFFKFVKGELYLAPVRRDDTNPKP